MLTRRGFLLSAGLSICSFGIVGCSAKNLPLEGMNFTDTDFRSLPQLGLATSLIQEYSYEAEVEGKIPVELRGTLYRNGPGLFERAGLRKRCLLEGDGMVQSFKIDAGKVHFRNKFVRTKKFKEESAAGKYLFPTWCTQAPGGLLSNLGVNNIESQAGVSVVVRDGHVYAFDEFQPPYELNPETLDTIGISWLGLPEGSTIFSSHSKIDQKNGDWLFFGLKYGKKPYLYLTILSRNGALKKLQKFPLPKYTYIHDFFVSEKHIIFNFHPVTILAQASIAVNLSLPRNRVSCPSRKYLRNRAGY